MCVLACKIWPLFKKWWKKYPFLRWNLKCLRKKFKPFKISIFLRKQENCSNDRLFTLYINIHKFIIQRQFALCKKKTCQFQISLYHPSKCSEGHYIHFLFVFTKYQVRNTPILWFCKIGFKIHLFLWKLEHTLEHKCSRTEEFPPGHQTGVLMFYLLLIIMTIIPK